jgi:hypothetical protein
MLRLSFLPTFSWWLLAVVVVERWMMPLVAVLVAIGLLLEPLAEGHLPKAR